MDSTNISCIPCFREYNVPLVPIWLSCVYKLNIGFQDNTLFFLAINRKSNYIRCLQLLIQNFCKCFVKYFHFMLGHLSNIILHNKKGMLLLSFGVLCEIKSIV